MDEMSIDNYDIIDLMGLSELNEDQRVIMLTEMNTLIWDSFLSERLRYLLTSEQIEQVKHRIEEGSGVEDVLKAILEYAPNFNNLLAEFTRTAKIEMITKHHADEIKENDRLMELTKEETSKTHLHKQREKHIKALEFIRREEWDKVLETFHIN